MEPFVRRDKLGRKIGYNWWREYVMAAYWPAREQWEIQFDLKANDTYRRGIIAQARRKSRRGGRNEIMDYVEEFPPPTLRAYLEDLAGTVGPHTLEPEAEPTEGE